MALKYQWYRDGVLINGAFKTTYLVGGADMGKRMTVRVTGSKAGYTTVTKTSAATAAVIPANLTVGTVKITGTVTAGKSLKAVLTGWGPTPFQTAFQWMRDGKPISRATGVNYNVVAADVNRPISVRITVSKQFYKSVTKFAYTAVITPGAPSATGDYKVGQTLVVTPGTWKPAPVSITYQWYRNGAKLAGQIRNSYKLVAADKGTNVKVIITGSKAGYAPVTISSNTDIIVQ